MKKRPLIIAGAAAATLAVVAAGIATWRVLQPKEEASFLIETAKVGDVEKAVLAIGAVAPAEVLEVGTEVGGELLRLHVKLGDKVKEGQVIAQMDPSRLEIRLRDRLSQLASEQARMLNFRSNLELAENNLKRQQELMDKGVASQVQYDNALNQLKRGQAQLSNFEESLKSREIAVKEAREELAKATIRAPMDGIVAEIVAREGQVLNTNRQTPVIARIARMDSMTVRAQVSEKDIINVRPGQKVYFKVLGDPKTRYHATLKGRQVTPVGGVLDPGASGEKPAIYYDAWFETPNPDRSLLPAMTAEVHIVLDEAKDVVTVPLTAVAKADDPGEAVVMVMGEDGEIEEREVVLGLSNAAVAEVKSGLKPGEQVVIGLAQGEVEPEGRGGLFSGLSGAL